MRVKMILGLVNEHDRLTQGGLFMQRDSPSDEHLLTGRKLVLVKRTVKQDRVVGKS